MPIHHEYKAIQTHIPKTAGTTISHILNLEREECKGYQAQNHNLFGDLGIREFGIPYQHITSMDIKGKIGEEVYNEYFKFSFIRNPWDRVVSELEWINSLKPKSQTGPPLTLKKLITTLKREKSLRMRTQVEYLRDENGKLSIDYLGRFENIKEDWIDIADALSAPLTVTNEKMTNLGFLINNTSRALYLRENDGPIFKLAPREKLQAFKRGTFKADKDFTIKCAYSIKTLQTGGYDIINVIESKSIRKTDCMNIPYYYGITTDGPPIGEFYCDEFINCHWTGFDSAGSPVHELKNLNIDVFHFNKSNRKNYKEYYDGGARRAVGRLYEEDVDTFKYTF